MVTCPATRKRSWTGQAPRLGKRSAVSLSGGLDNRPDLHAEPEETRRRPQRLTPGRRCRRTSRRLSVHPPNAAQIWACAVQPAQPRHAPSGLSAAPSEPRAVRMVGRFSAGIMAAWARRKEGSIRGRAGWETARCDAGGVAASSPASVSCRRLRRAAGSQLPHRTAADSGIGTPAAPRTPRGSRYLSMERTPSRPDRSKSPRKAV